ncbi:hypothetical protein CEUSTIGMA_g8237.t1 [Chlamydomonas eustigma]|uniref:Uncharacterized protein n=1 Tax=Chlamydomonas eustigma TaxID=1157962 RepID=A0A250XCK1_9CHLO|nr:hypothetical protein CEUSTIGMA_g8237.t1 [Chlamydomonas eustigma]|eukprot:GAX80801.1 hypothetical protein CEUSTIGMA_g8237.t1 [Chlamydomonas eustigma]
MLAQQDAERSAAHVQNELEALKVQLSGKEEVLKALQKVIEALKEENEAYEAQAVKVLACEEEKCSLGRKLSSSRSLLIVGACASMRQCSAALKDWIQKSIFKQEFLQVQVGTCHKKTICAILSVHENRERLRRHEIELYSVLLVYAISNSHMLYQLCSNAQQIADRGGLSTARGGAHQRSATPALTPTASLMKSCASSTSTQSGAGANAHSSASTPTTSFGRMESSSTGPSSSTRKQLAGSSTAGCRFRNLNAYVHRLPGLDCTVKAGVALMAEEGFLPYIWGGNDVTENDVMLVHTSAMRLSGLRSSRATPKKLQYDDVE